MTTATKSDRYWMGRTYLCSDCAEEARAESSRVEEATEAQVAEMIVFGANRCDWCDR